MTRARPIGEDDLQAHIDGRLDPKRTAEVEAWLAANPQEAARIDRLRADRALLRDILMPAETPLPPELRLENVIEAAFSRRRHAGLGPWRSVAAALALLLLGGAGGWIGHDLHGPADKGIAALAQEASDGYRAFAGDRERPVELRDRTALVAWMSQRLARPVTAPDLSAAGYRLMGGRMLATPHGPAAMFMYDDDKGTRLVMLQRPMAVEGEAPMRAHEEDGIAGLSWARAGLGYSLVGPAAPAILHPLANEIRRQSTAT